jgi:hypothetical protein
MDYDDDLLDPAPGDPFNAWAIGVVGALALTAYGVSCIYTRSATWVGGSDLAPTSMPCRGATAVGVGIASVAVAGLLHCHFFWSWRRNCQGYAEIGKAISLLGVAGGMFYFIFHWLVD